MQFIKEVVLLYHPYGTIGAFAGFWIGNMIHVREDFDLGRATVYTVAGYCFPITCAIKAYIYVKSQLKDRN